MQIISETTPEYEAFVEKFKPKLTTDDCYTPPIVYEAVADWCAKSYGLNKSRFVRPFYPGGDYEHFAYPEGCTVVDNPPFSIMAEIVPFYCKHDIKFLLFNQHATGMKKYAFDLRCTVLATGVSVTYENGAVVCTSFITNLETEYIIRSVPELTEAVKKANAQNQKEITKQFPKYDYPDNIVTCAMVGKYSKYGVDYGVRYGEAVRVHTLDAQKCKGKGVFGGGLLISTQAAAEKAAAEKWTLSEREMVLIRKLDGRYVCR